MGRRKEFITTLPHSVLPQDLFPEARPLNLSAPQDSQTSFRSISGYQSMDDFRSIGSASSRNSEENPRPITPIAPIEPVIDRAGIAPSPSLTLARRANPNLISTNNDITDPIKRIIADALTLAGIAFKHEMSSDRIEEEKAKNATNDIQSSAKPILDFKLEDGPYIEVRQYSSDRSNKQLASQPNVILIQGRMAAYWFAEQLLLPKAQTSPAPINLFKRCMSTIRKAFT